LSNLLSDLKFNLKFLVHEEGSPPRKQQMFLIILLTLTEYWKLVGIKKEVFPIVIP